MRPIVLIGYSGHAFVVNDLFESQGNCVQFYCDIEEKKHNPLQLIFLGEYDVAIKDGHFQDKDFFISIGNNSVRWKIQSYFLDFGIKPINAIHANSFVSGNAQLMSGVMISVGATVNAFAKIGNGVIINTGAIIEHECTIGAFTHIAPGAVLAGNVDIGDMTFVGANSVIKQGIKIGKNVTIGAGSVILKDIPDGATVVGNPGRILNKY